MLSLKPHSEIGTRRAVGFILSLNFVAISAITSVSCKSRPFNADSSGSTEQAIVGSDNRQWLADSQAFSSEEKRRWQARVGGIYLDGRHRCTGFLAQRMGSDVVEVFTSDHCVPTWGGIVSGRVVFRRSQRNDVILKSVGEQWTKQDLLTLQAEDPTAFGVQANTLLPLTNVPLNETLRSKSGASTIELWSWDPWKLGLVYHAGCGVLSESPTEWNHGIFAHRCDTIKGASGSPLVHRGKVIGAHLGSSPEHDSLQGYDPISPLNFGVMFPLGSRNIWHSKIINKRRFEFESAKDLSEIEDMLTNPLGKTIFKGILTECAETGKTQFSGNRSICKLVIDVGIREGLVKASDVKSRNKALGGLSTKLEGCHLSVEGEAKTATLQMKGVWKDSNQIRIRFLNGEFAQQQEFLRIANAWSAFTRLKFKRVEDHGDVRVSLPEGTEPRCSFAMLGTSNLDGLSEQSVSLQVGRLAQDGSSLPVGLVLHLMGHVLGLGNSNDPSSIMFEEGRNGSISNRDQERAAEAYPLRAGQSCGFEGSRRLCDAKAGLTCQIPTGMSVGTCRK